MRWSQLEQIVGSRPLFESSMLLAGDLTRHQVHRQLSDWTRARKVIQLRRGLYTFPDRNPHPFIVANRLVPGSYVSLQMALSHYHLIPEHVATVTSVTTQRPGRYENRYGRFTYRHIAPALFYGIVFRFLVDDEYAFVATPEKALLDLIHFRPSGDSMTYIESLRLQNLDTLDLGRLHGFAKRSGKPKLRRAAGMIEAIAMREAEEYEPL